MLVILGTFSRHRFDKTKYQFLVMERDRTCRHLSPRETGLAGHITTKLPSHMHHSRRSFLHRSGLASAGLVMTGWPTITAGMLQRTPPSDQINVGLIGCRGRGFRVLQRHLAAGGVTCLGLCDVDGKVLRDRAADLAKAHGTSPKQYKDFRKMLEDKDIDAVIIGTPDHWHCLQTVMACQAGKDVYVEKPLANSIAECQLIEQAEQRYGRVVQVGQQQRSADVWNEVMDFMKAGKLGRIHKSNIWANFNYGVGPSTVPDEQPPEDLDFDMWLGPAPERSFNRSRLHGSWRHFWHYGGGLMTDWGVHLIDMSLWVKDITQPPTEVLAYGSKLDRPDLAKETYDAMSVIFPFDDYVIQWESNAGKQVGPYDRLYGIAFLGEKGTLVVDRSGWQVIPEWDNAKKAHKIEAHEATDYKGGTDNHVRNFLDCIKSRETPSCPASLGSNVALYTHMANIAVRSGSHRLAWDRTKNRFIKDKQANQFIQPAYRKPWKMEL